MELFSTLILFLIGISETRAYHQEDYTFVYERVDVDSFDEKFMKLKAHTFKYNRTQAVTNITLDFKIDFGNRLKVIVQGYKFTSNEYRLFPIVYDRNICKSMKENEFGIRNIYKCGHGFTCPMKKGNYSICKWSLDGPQLPPFIPSGHYMLQLKYDFLATEVGIVNVYFTVKRFFDRK